MPEPLWKPSQAPEEIGRSILTIVIPTINRADLLRESLESLAHQADFYHELIVIDNGNQAIELPCPRSRVIGTNSNLGVAASWNLGIEMALSDPSVEHVLVLNDDVILDCAQLERINRSLAGHPETWLFVGPFHWAAWAISREGVNAILNVDSHLFDENFFPAYFEDNDFMYRFSKRFPERVQSGLAVLDPHVKRNASSAAKDRALKRGYQNNKTYYQTKWGGGVGRETRHPHQELTLEACYKTQCETPSDIYKHVPTLCALAETCQHVTELGTGRGSSTWGFLYGRPRRLVTYDKVMPPSVALLARLALSQGVEFEFIKADVLEIQIEETDLLFIDTLHNYQQLRNELIQHAGRVRKFIVMHDTTSFGFKDEVFDGEILAKRGLIAALVDFLESPGGADWEHYGTDLENNGLTILTRSSSRASAELGGESNRS